MPPCKDILVRTPTPGGAGVCASRSHSHLHACVPSASNNLRVNDRLGARARVRRAALRHVPRISPDEIVCWALDILQRRLRIAGCTLSSPEAVRDYLRFRWRRRHEVFMVLFLDSQHRCSPATNCSAARSRNQRLSARGRQGRARAQRRGGDLRAQPSVGRRRAVAGRRAPHPVAEAGARAGGHPHARSLRRGRHRVIGFAERACCEGAREVAGAAVLWAWAVIGFKVLVLKLAAGFFAAAILNGFSATPCSSPTLTATATADG